MLRRGDEWARSARPAKPQGLGRAGSPVRGARAPPLGAEAVPLGGESFDVAISEYGASIWCDPYRWIPDTARLIRLGGELVFLVNGTQLMLCIPDEENRPAGDRLIRPYLLGWTASSELSHFRLNR